MSKILRIFIYLIFLTFFSLILLLMTIGIETKRFNNFIVDKILITYENLFIDLNSIKFKLDLSETSLFLEADKPILNYRKTSVPVKNIKVYVDFLSLIKTKPSIKKINLILEQLNMNELKNLSVVLKPSNFRSLISNNIDKGIIDSEIEFYFNNDNDIKNFIAKGNVTNLDFSFKENISFKKVNFNFFADQSDILIQNFFGNLNEIKIKDGDIRIEVATGIKINSNFSSDLILKDKLPKKYLKFLNNFEFGKNISYLDVSLNNNLKIKLDKTYKVDDYSYDISGKINRANIEFKKPKKIEFTDEKIDSLEIKKSDIRSSFSTKKNTSQISGKYSINKKNFKDFNVKHDSLKDYITLNIDIDFDRKIEIDLINYYKPEGINSNFSLIVKKRKDKIIINKLNYLENQNQIIIEELNLKSNNFISVKNIAIKTFDKSKKNNDFKINFGKKINLQGDVFDASNIFNEVNKDSKDNFLKNISKEIEIDLNKVVGASSNKLNNFKLIGLIKNGQFQKISSKGDFGDGKFLDITMKYDEKNDTKNLEIYSDLPQALLTNYNFFRGLTGGSLLFNSSIRKDFSKSGLKIENFKVINAPGMVKLLSLADLSGLADLAQGDGISFDTLEINFTNSKGFKKFEDIFAVGPSISVLMDGYQDKSGLTSIRGTLVPAKNLNKLLSKIPVIGNIIIPKEVGEGLFGVSFKIKGTTGKMKTTINPIRTVTPRFIQKIIDKKKNTK